MTAAVATKLTFNEIEAVWIAGGGSAEWAPLMAGIALAESGGDPTALNNNPSTGDYSVGLWQINYYGSLLGPRTKAYGSPASLQNDTEAQVAAANSILGGGGGLSAWAGDPIGQVAINDGKKPLSAAQTLALLQQKSIGTSAQLADALESPTANVAPGDKGGTGTGTGTPTTTGTPDPSTGSGGPPSWLLAIAPGLSVLWKTTDSVSSAQALEEESVLVLRDITSVTFWKRVGTGVLGVALFIIGLVIFFDSTDTGKKAVSEGESAAKSAAAVAAVA